MTGTPRLLDIWLKRMEKLRAMRQDASSPRRAWVCDVRLRVLDYMVARYGKEDPSSPNYPHYSADALEDDFESLPMQVTFTADGAWMPTDNERASIQYPPKDTEKFSKVLRNIASANAERTRDYALDRGRSIQNMTLPPFEKFKLRVSRIDPGNLLHFPDVIKSPTWVAARSRWNVDIPAHEMDARRYAFVTSMISNEFYGELSPDELVRSMPNDHFDALHCLISEQDVARAKRIGDIPIGAVQFTRIDGDLPATPHARRPTLDALPQHTWIMHSLVGRNLPWLSTFLPGLLEFAELSLTHGLFQGQLITRCTRDMNSLLSRLDWDVDLDLTNPLAKELPVVMRKNVG